MPLEKCALMKRRVVVLFLICLSAMPVLAQQGINTSEQNQGDGNSPLVELGNDYYNGIKLLQNRFRIDYKVEEITMIFFREFGSTPVVLVQPDGSKIFQNQADDMGIDWFDSQTYDMIRIRNPMPGPWQAVGQILPDSRVMVISDIQLETKPLAPIIFSGEIIKQTAFLTNGGQPIDYNEFRDVVQLTMEFKSTNNPNYANFGAQTELIATFQDDGKGLDERPLDGTFTGQFNLRIASGEWTPIFTIVTPMFTRQKVGEDIRLLDNPISIDVELDEEGDGFHLLQVDADRTTVDMSSLLVDGKVRFPNGDVQNFSITDITDKVRTYEIVNFEYGVFRVKLTAYGNTVDGRDFILDVPEYTFVFEEPLLETTLDDLSALPGDAQSAEALALQELERLKAAPVEDEGMPRSQLIGIVVGINLFIVVAGVFLLWFFLVRGKKPVAQTTPVADEEKQSLFAKLSASLKGLMPKKKSEEGDGKKLRSPDEAGDSGIIELSMPD
ncbi:TIGR03503 family protein [Planctobacterium marinum]|uniref:TIGR03503 family protein n=2 Tax=Planctobacterium marinum TaxID=1631968 RepID=A0AA48KP79_9ALTE|nr:TIGR03503 family protein [Planctobacterium marinum]